MVSVHLVVDEEHFELFIRITYPLEEVLYLGDVHSSFIGASLICSDH